MTRRRTEVGLRHGQSHDSLWEQVEGEVRAIGEVGNRSLTLEGLRHA